MISLVTPRARGLPSYLRLMASPTTDTCQELFARADEAFAAGDKDLATDIGLELLRKGCISVPLGPSASPS
jgi:hypothetical protein